MKLLNIIIRTYKLENLVISLDDLPHKITSNYVNLIIHNDNPERGVEFNDILNKFHEVHPEYEVIPVQESVNQQMFFSYINSIKALPDAKYTMILDDDDRLCTIDGEFIEFLESTNNIIKYRYSKFSRTKYGFTPIKTSGYWTAWYKWHRITPTDELKKVLEYESWISSKLLEYNGSTKFSMCEDELMYKLITHISDRTELKYDRSIMMYDNTPHTTNDYTSYTTTGEDPVVERCHSIVSRIIEDYEAEFNNKDLQS